MSRPVRNGNDTTPMVGVDADDVVYVMWGDRGLGVRITSDLQVYEWFVAPTVDLRPIRDQGDQDDAIAEAVDEARRDLRDAVMDAFRETLREQLQRLSEALDVDQDDLR